MMCWLGGQNNRTAAIGNNLENQVWVLNSFHQEPYAEHFVSASSPDMKGLVTCHLVHVFLAATGGNEY